MIVFVAHTNYDKEFALKIAQRITKSGHQAIAGEQIRADFSEFSFVDDDVAKAIRNADTLVAVGLHTTWYANVASEIAFFTGHGNDHRTVLLTTQKLVSRAPKYLAGERLVYFDGDEDAAINEILRHVDELGERHQRSSDQIFLSYSRVDVEIARTIYEKLKIMGYRLWFDEESLIPGQDWGLEIRRAIRRSQVFMPLLSSNAIAKRGYFQKELRKSVEVAEEVPEGEIYIIPVLLDTDCEPPEALKKYHWLNYHSSDLERTEHGIPLSRFQRALDFALGVKNA
ncbi:toll/interleukin-1 receptor domain-containing protein [Acaryochloris marina]|uniref:toll/interleukin-1 receptor domain-containing protein n=1 Tax=Acaryochloris marina TaxID=155978 RepID=UPI001BB0122C|nr:toll/interleukin-1 receptor domain-containing protein [Acaryochloris marina]QUY41849.1 toll/interleukin-1 receptor domain-containing protein [Acaryochloris marina S15]